MAGLARTFLCKPFPLYAPGVCHRQSCHGSRTGEGTAISGFGILEWPGPFCLPPSTPPLPEPPSRLLHPTFCTGAGLHHCRDQLLCPLASCWAGPTGASARGSGRGTGAGTFIPPLPCVGVAVGRCVPWLKATAPDRQLSLEVPGATPSLASQTLEWVRALAGADPGVQPQPWCFPHTLPAAL